MKNRKSIRAELRQLVSSKTSPQEMAPGRSTQLAIETLEERMMLNGTTETLVFSAGFEDVDVASGGFAAVRTTSGFTSIGGSVEVQNNPGGVGPASEGQQHLELDGLNGIFVDLTPASDSDLILQFDYSARPFVDAPQNAICLLYTSDAADE